LIIAMLAARQAVSDKIVTIKSSVGTTISIQPAGYGGGQGGGDALTSTQLASISSTAHVTSTLATLRDRLTSSNTNLVSSIETGSLGQ
jgi:putative ABC transport system permease protein